VVPMPTLHVRNVPEDVYIQLQKRAQAQQRSLRGMLNDLW
jgi:plasmid stability protein